VTKPLQIHRGIFRASAKPITALPIGVRSIGEYHVDRAWKDVVKTVDHVQLFWGIAGEGHVLLNGRPERLVAQHTVIYLPGDPYELRTTSPFWHFRWITLDGALSADIVRAFGLPQTSHFAGPCPEKIFVRLEHEIREHTPAGQRTAAATAYELLSLACGYTSRAGSLVQNAIESTHRRFSEPGFNITELAHQLNVNRSQLSREFKERTGVTLIDFITAQRIQHALSLLKETELSIEEISRRSGYTDPDYFARVVRKTVGVSPTEFRRQ